MFLISDKPLLVQRGLSEAKEAWECLEVAEQKALELNSVQAVLNNVGWAFHTWPREVLLALAQWQFQWCPDVVKDTIRCMFEGYGQSIINENANNRVKDAMRDSKGLIISRDKRLYILAATKIIFRHLQKE